MKLICFLIFVFIAGCAFTSWAQTNLPPAPLVPATNTLPVAPTATNNPSLTRAVTNAPPAAPTGLVRGLGESDSLTKQKVANDIQTIQDATTVSP